jgi:tryptophanyl-tRNA synthetase
MNRIFSGVQPTGNMHIGNYLGALKNWVRLQHDYDCIFSIVDLHAITVPQDPAELRAATRDVAATYIAAGIDPTRCIIFNQSMVSMHAELAWILSCVTPLGWLNRMTQFKDKAGKHRDTVGLGLFAYPVLMAADILGYKATHVPVGEDQKQHLELARDIAQAFNRQFGEGVLVPPEPLILGPATRVMSLRDGSKKMSKSDESDYSRIHVGDDPDTIALKIRKAKTDPLPLPDSIEAMETRPEAANLLTIFAAITDTAVDQVVARFAGTEFSRFKETLTEAIIAGLDPIRRERDRLLADQTGLDAILREGAARANAIARPILREVLDRVGMLRP